MTDLNPRVIAASSIVKARLAEIPEVFVILGSGFKYFTQDIQPLFSMKLSDITHWPVPSVVGHGGELLVLKVGSKKIGFLTGRVHMYEGYSEQDVVFSVAVLKHLGCKTLLLTNAAGSLKKDLKPGTIALMKDHLNLTGRNCLSVKSGDLFSGENANHSRPGFTINRFLDMTGLYDPKLVAKLRQKLKLKAVVYAGLLGPSFETRAECQMLAKMGADVVGMSTVQEAIAGHFLGMKVLGISFVTNFAGPKTHKGELTGHHEVIDIAQKSQKKIVDVLKKVLGVISE